MSSLNAHYFVGCIIRWENKGCLSIPILPNCELFAPNTLGVMFEFEKGLEFPTAGKGLGLPKAAAAGAEALMEKKKDSLFVRKKSSRSL